jgi:hypothetical protein
MGILLHKMKLFSPFVRKHFRGSPQFVSLVFFLVCLLIDIPIFFGFKIVSLGDYYYVDSSHGVKHTASFYYFVSSDFSQTLYGQVLLGLSTFFINLFLSLVVGIVLNILSFFTYKSFARQRKQEIEQLRMSSINNQPTLTRELEQMNERKKTERKLERNMLYMALTLCSISILSRLTLMTMFILYFLYTSFSNSLILFVVTLCIYSFGPFVSTFVFYSFNKMFRDETNKKFRIRSALSRD